MAIAKVTYHSASYRPSYTAGSEAIGVYPEQIGDRASLDFTSAAAHGGAQSSAVIARVLSDTDCGIGVTGPSTAITIAKTMAIKAGVAETIYIPAGQRLGVIAES